LDKGGFDMKLAIVNSPIQATAGVYVLTAEQFAMKEYQPFLASTCWDEVRIDLGEDMPLGVVRQIIRSNKVIPCFDPTKLSLKIVKLLCEICVDESAIIWKLYTSDREALTEFLVDLGKKRGWG